MNPDDTICALSSPAGHGARSIVRLSGARSFEIANALGAEFLEHAVPNALHLILTPSLSGAKSRIDCTNTIDIPATIYAFRSPRSYTGEDLIEFHLPGSPFLSRRVIESCIAHGARQAGPGEFTARAYLNGKLDLAAAEGVAAAIAASSRRELDAARQLLAGELARRLKPSMDLLAETLALVEVGIDFADEEVTFLSRDEVRSRISEVQHQLSELLLQSTRFERLSHEPRIVLAGRPNAGKSTLINALAGQVRAVVSEVAGTTRDALSARVRLRRGVVTVIDIAGIDDGDEPSNDSIAQQMRATADREIAQADVLIVIRDPADAQRPLDLNRKPHLIAFSKSDLHPRTPSPNSVSISARTGAGIDALKDRLDHLAFGPDGADVAQSLALNARHVERIDRATVLLDHANGAIGTGDELVAHSLREALDELGQILGIVSPDELLGQIFSRFCIGK